MTISETTGATAAPPRGLELLELMPPDVRRFVEAAFVPERYAFGEVIVREGDPAESFYALTRGDARVLKSGEGGAEVSLNVLRAGDAFGERALLMPGERRSATVRASSQIVEVQRLDRAIFEALVQTNPQVRDVLELHVQRYELSNFLRLHVTFAQLPPAGMSYLVAGLRQIQVAAGAKVVTDGAPTDTVYIVRRGRLRLSCPNGSEQNVSFLREGDFFGELTILPTAPRHVTVDALTDCDLLTPPVAVMGRLIKEYADFAEEIGRRAAALSAGVRRVPLDFAEDLPESVAAQDDAPVASRMDSAAGGEEPPDLLPTSETDPESFSRPTARDRRFPHLFQVDEMDCGAACVAIVCRHLGRRVSLARVRKEVNTAIDGTSLLGIASGAERLGLRSQLQKVSPSRVDEMPLPAIIHWGNNHWVVLYWLDDTHAWLSDPARGRRRVPRTELHEKWSGYAAFLAATPALAEVPEEGSQAGWLWEFFRPYRKIFVGAMLLSLAAAAAEMAIPALSGLIVDRVIPRRDTGTLTLVVLGMGGALALTVIATALQRVMLSRVAVIIDGASLDHLASRLLALPVSYFHSRRTGDIERRLNGLRQVRQFLVQQGVVGLAAATQVLVAVGVMSTISGILAVLYLAALPLYAALMRYSKVRLQPTYDALEEAWAKYGSLQIDSIRGIETVKAMGAESALRGLLTGQFNHLSGRLYRADLTAMLYEVAVQLISILTLALFLWIGALEVLNHNLTIGGLVSFNALVLLANGPVVMVLSLWDQFQYSGVLLGRLNDILEQEPEQGADHDRLRPVPTLSGHVRWRNVSFGYPGAKRHPVLEDINFEVLPGTKVALVGRSGSGKTTLVKCLAGLLEPTAGTILYDGVPLNELHYGQVRRQIGFVMQETHIFDGTIASNIAFGEASETIDHERVAWAARVASVHDFIEQLPLGYETRIGESGMQISGGQRQRIAIARAIYHRPAVLVLDEATSALDTESERAVKENMDELLRGRTSFIIAHRLSTVRDADLILVLEKGRIVERGSHDELMSRQGLYFYLNSQQLQL